MNKIYFDDLTHRKRSVPEFVLSVFLLFVTLGFFTDIENKFFSISLIVGMILIAMVAAGPFWYGSYVRWNSNGMVIRIRSLVATTFRFDEVKSAVLEDRQLVITRIEGESLVFDQHKVNESDAWKLNELILNRIA